MTKKKEPNEVDITALVKKEVQHCAELIRDAAISEHLEWHIKRNVERKLGEMDRNRNEAFEDLKKVFKMDLEEMNQNLHALRAYISKGKTLVKAFEAIIKAAHLTDYKGGR